MKNGGYNHHKALQYVLAHLSIVRERMRLIVTFSYNNKVLILILILSNTPNIYISPKPRKVESVDVAKKYISPAKIVNGGRH